MAYPLTPGPLTRRQLDCLREYARLGSRKEAAVALGITDGVVREHLRHAYYRLDVGYAIEAFRALGWLKVPS